MIILDYYAAIMMSPCVIASHALIAANTMKQHPPVNAIIFSDTQPLSISPPTTAIRFAIMCAAM